MVERVICLHKEQRMLDAHQAQFAPRHFPQFSPDQHKGWHTGLKIQASFNLFARNTFIGRQFIKK